jgi:hypothetical protein
MFQDFSGVFGKLLCRLRETTTFGIANAKIIPDALPKAPKGSKNVVFSMKNSLFQRPCVPQLGPLRKLGVPSISL